MEGERNNINDEEHHEAFGEQTNISEECRHEINLIKNNDPNVRWFEMDPNDVEYFSDLAWELFGRYNAENDHLEDLGLDYCGLTDEKTTLLFKHLKRSTSLKRLFLSNNNFRIDGIQSMIPLLKNAPNLNTLRTNNNHNINAECFRLLINSLSSRSITQLNFGECNVDDITALENYSLPHLEILDLRRNNIENIPSLDKYANLDVLQLYGNNIGKEGCRSISNLLENNSSRLRMLCLDSNDVGDEEAEMLADSLERNTTLAHLALGGNKLKEKGMRAFLKILNNASSVDKTYNSNHTLKNLQIPDSKYPKHNEIVKHIGSSLKINNESDAPGRDKVMMTQLNSIARMELCRLQGVDYSYSALFAEIDAVLLPTIIALVGGVHGQSEIYRMLIATVPELASIVNKKVFLKERIATHAYRIAALDDVYADRAGALFTKYTSQLATLSAEKLCETAALDAEHLETMRQLESVGSGGGEHPLSDKTLTSETISSGKKRNRST